MTAKTNRILSLPPAMFSYGKARGKGRVMRKPGNVGYNRLSADTPSGAHGIHTIAVTHPLATGDVSSSPSLPLVLEPGDDIGSRHGAHVAQRSETPHE